MKTILLPFTILILSWSHLLAADPVSVQLQRALFDEEANHDLDAAITAYQSILNSHEEERKLVATALFRLGECYRKLGRTNDAATQYQRLVRDFTEQNNLVRLSEQNLVALGRPRGMEAVGAVGASTVRPRPSPRERKLIEEQIALTEKQLASVRQAIEKGVQAVDADMPYRQAVARLRRELAMAEEPASKGQQQKWLEEEINLQEKVVARAKQLIANGLAAAGSEIESEKELLGLKRKLAALETGDIASQPDKPGSGNSEAGAAGVASDEKPDLQGVMIKRLETMLRDSPDLINAPGENPPLHQAVVSSQVRVATFLLDHGAEVDLKDKHGKTPLYRAAEVGDRVMAQLLLERNANPNLKNSSSQTPLMIAASYGHKSIVESLLAHGADVSAANYEGQTALYVAVDGNKKEIMEVLLAHKADANVRTRSDVSALDRAVELDSMLIIKLLLSRGANVNAKARNGITPLVKAVSSGNQELVEFLLSQHADPNARCESKLAEMPDTPDHSPPGRGSPLQSRRDSLTAQLTPLMWAAHDGNQAIAQSLLKSGADVNASDANGATALHWAVRRDRQPMVELLLNAGAEPNAQTRTGLTPLWTAAYLGRESLASVLLERGARPNLADEPEAPLAVAVRFGHKAVIELLLERGADPAATDQQGQTALDLAKQPGMRVAIEQGRNLPTISDAELVTFLRSRGANEYVPRKGLITYCRISRGVNRAVFFKGTNDFNQHTLLELLASLYSEPSSRDSADTMFPDMSNVRISRRDPKDGQVRELKVDLAALISAAGAARDVPLAWGDVVEIPEVDHRANEKWPGFAPPDAEAIDQILTRQIEVRIKGETNRLTLQPPPVLRFNRPPAPPPPPPNATSAVLPGAPPSFPAPQGLNVIAGGARLELASSRGARGFWLRDVLYGANVLRVSSDTRRVKIKRTDPTTKQPREFLFDLAANPSGRPGNELWLQNGDIIEVPEKQ